MKEIEQINNVVVLLNDVIALELKLYNKISDSTQSYIDYYYKYLSLIELKYKWEINKIKY